jgi:hypothetical protein
MPAVLHKHAYLCAFSYPLGRLALVYIHLTSENCSHSRKLINSFIVVCAVVSSSNHPCIIAVALSVSSPHLPLVVWYQETNLQCLLVFPWLGTARSAQTVVIVSFAKLLSTNKIFFLRYLYITSYYEERPLSFPRSKFPKKLSLACVGL